MFLLYENIDKDSPHGVLDKEFLKKVKEVEDYVKSRDEWKNLCYA
jgi:hypothetical protein|tara:strand:- start:439 stop:573 length:135 start_codon:yes stop_codon:yes gene_type:complete